MKFFSRLGIYKASNVTFNPNTVQAYSYDWWKFVAVINGFVVFNNYRYSVSTGKHQSKVRRLMDELGLKIDVYVNIPEGLQTSDVGRKALTHAYANESKDQIKAIKKVFKTKLSRDEIQTIYDAKEESIALQYIERSIKRQERQDKLNEIDARDKAKQFDKQLVEVINPIDGNVQ